jgi:hypothetical protein
MPMRSAAAREREVYRFVSFFRIPQVTAANGGSPLGTINPMKKI